MIYAKPVPNDIGTPLGYFDARAKHAFDLGVMIDYAHTHAGWKARLFTAWVYTKNDPWRAPHRRRLVLVRLIPPKNHPRYGSCACIELPAWDSTWLNGSHHERFTDSLKKIAEDLGCSPTMLLDYIARLLQFVC